MKKSCCTAAAIIAIATGIVAAPAAAQQEQEDTRRIKVIAVEAESFAGPTAAAESAGTLQPFAKKAFCEGKFICVSYAPSKVVLSGKLKARQHRDFTLDDVTKEINWRNETSGKLEGIWQSNDGAALGQQLGAAQ